MKTNKLSVAKKIIIAVAAVILALIIAGGVYCVSTQQNPAEAAKTIFTDNEELLIGKWQSQENPGVSAYVFYDDESYDSYLSTVNFTGRYTISGNKLALINPSTSKEIVYKFSVTEKELTLTLVEEDGKKPEEKEVSKYDRVDELNQISFPDLIEQAKEGNETTTETEE